MGIRMKTINDSFRMTEHCQQRAAQRGHLEPVVDLLLKYGDVLEQKGEASVVTLSKKQRNAIMKELKRCLQILGKQNDVYIVVAEDGSLMTIGRRTQTIRHIH